MHISAFSDLHQLTNWGHVVERQQFIFEHQLARLRSLVIECQRAVQIFNTDNRVRLRCLSQQRISKKYARATILLKASKHILSLVSEGIGSAIVSKAIFVKTGKTSISLTR